MNKRQKLFQSEIDPGFAIAGMSMFLGLMALLISLILHKNDVELRAPASINRAVLVLVKPSNLFGPSGETISPELIDAYNKVKSEQKPFDPRQVIPDGLQPSADSGLIFSRIADRSVSSFFNSSQMRSTPLGQTATTVEQKMKQDVTVESEGVKHRMIFQVQAFQGFAKVDYTGLANATLKYQSRESIVGLEIYEKITKTKELVLGQLNKPDDRISSVHLRWNF